LTELKNKGLIKSIGCSNFGVAQLEESLQYAEIDYLQIPANLLQPENRDIGDFCQIHHISIIAYNVLAHGLLTGKYTNQTIFAANDRRSRISLFQGEHYRSALAQVDRFREVAAAQGLSVAQYAIQWVLSQKSVVSAITGIKSVEQLQQNFLAIGGLK
jgi:aryl-alcohol dehydrogenase-like predicted oxidoreductase